MGILNIRGRQVIFDDEDRKLIESWNWCINKSGHCEYARGSQVGNSKHRIYMHRLVTGAQKGQEIDHKNGNGLDNRKKNLRICSRSENNANRSRVQSKSSMFKGVHYEKYTGRWRAEIHKDGTHHRLGRFNSQEEAAQAYLEKAKELFGEFANGARKS